MQKQQDAIAVVIPCYNEAVTIGKVVRDFKRVLPLAAIYVFDNDSSDQTAEAAQEAGAIVIREKRRGKGHVVQSILKKVDAEYFVMVDGDDTYPAEYAAQLLDEVVKDRADMAVGNRLVVHEGAAFRPFHVLGNNLVRGLVNKLFGTSLRDIMSGYRVFSREVGQGITILTGGFEVETEMTLQCLNKGFVIREADIPYRARHAGSHSKLRTFSDGYRVIKAIFIIFRDYRPLLFFGLLAGFLLLIGIASGSVVVIEFIHTRFITHVPLAILAVGCVVSGFLMFGVGLILDSIKNRLNELYSYVQRRGSR
ncbi:MAG TPA: glycosyltransferase [Nitrospiria bacterium]|nr:glycosyltransferase [Nitrospiria bacterium]